MWQIISVGDEAYLYRIFQFLAMLQSLGFYAKIGLLGALIGLMMIAAQAVMNEGRHSFVHLAIGIVLFVTMFGETTTVTLVDYHSGRTDVVDNIPLGTAIVGTVISQAGSEITQLWQQGTSVPGYETMAPDFALDALEASRSITNGSICESTNPAACAFFNSLRMYVRQCYVPTGVNGTSNTSGGNVTIAGSSGVDPRWAPNALQAIAVKNDALSVNTEIASLQGGAAPTSFPTTTVTCTQAYQYLEQASQNQAVTDGLSGAYLAAAQQKSAAQGSATTPVSNTPGQNTSNAQEMIQAALQLAVPACGGGGGGSSTTTSGSVGQSNCDTTQYLNNAIVAHALVDEQSYGHDTPEDIANAAMLEGANNRRNVSFASEQSMFTRTLQATMTFFEGVIYGLAPFVAFLIPMGPIGMKFFGRYLQLLLMLFLWLPLLSFVDLFEIMSVARQMNALQGASYGGQMTSTIGIMQTQYSVGDWIAMGGWLSSAVIGLSGMLVYGGVAAFQSIASTAHGPDQVDPSSLAPEFSSAAPMMSIGSNVLSTPGQGMSQNGAIYRQFNMQIAHQQREAQTLTEMNALSSSLDASLSHSEKYMHSVQEGVTARQGDQIQHGAGLTQSSAAQAGTTYDAKQGRAWTASDMSKNSQTEKLAENTTTGASAGVGLGGNAGGVASANVGVNTSKSVADVKEQTIGKEHSDGTKVDYSKGATSTSSQSHGLSANLTDQQLESMASDKTWGSSNGFGSEDAKQISEKAQRLLDLRQQYASEVSDTRAESQSVPMDERQYSEQLLQNQDRFNSAVDHARALGGGQFDALAENMYESGKYQSYEQAQAAAAGITLFDEMGRGNDSHRAMAESAFWESTGMGGEFGAFKPTNAGGGAADAVAAHAADDHFKSELDSAGHLQAPSSAGVSDVGTHLNDIGQATSSQTPDEAYAGNEARTKKMNVLEKEHIKDGTNFGIRGPEGFHD